MMDAFSGVAEFVRMTEARVHDRKFLYHLDLPANNFIVFDAQLLMAVIRKKAATKKSFANMITVIRLHLMSYVDLLDFIKDTYKAWRRTHNAPITFIT